MGYVVECGSLDCYVNKAGNNDYGMKVVEYSSGMSFGELALMYNTPRAATVVATSDVVLWGMERVTFRTIVMQRIVQKRVKFDPVLHEAELFKQLDERSRAMVADELEFKQFAAGADIVTQGDSANHFFLLTEGKATAHITEGGAIHEVMHYGSGDYFGEVGLLLQSPRTATVRAVTECECVSLERGPFMRLMRGLFGTLEQVMQQYTQHSALERAAAGRPCLT